MENKKICHVCGKEKKPYVVFLNNDVLSLISHEQAREDGEICKRCDSYFAMTGEFKDATEKEFKIAQESLKFASMMLKWWEKDKKLYAGEPDDYLPENFDENKRNWEGTHAISKWYREENTHKHSKKG